MKWIKLSLETTTAAEDLVSNMLDELGVMGIEIEDKVPITEEEKKKMFIDILPELGPDDGKAVINFYLDVNTDVKEMTEKVTEGLNELRDFVDVGSGVITCSETEDKDWINNWKQFFKPFRVDDTIVIKPTWEAMPEIKKDDIVVEIDPGTSFGTGSHETTRLCILNLKKYLKKDDLLLDVGCGSGILSIIGDKLGAKACAAIDIDPNAAASAKENCEVNNIKACRLERNEKAQLSGDRIEIYDGDVMSDSVLVDSIGRETYDVVVANILADVIIPLSSMVSEFMKPGALFISSGIIDIKAEEVKEAITKNGFEFVEVTTMGDWTSVVARKPLS